MPRPSANLQQEKIAPGFAKLLEKHDRPSLRTTSNVVYGLWNTYCLAYLNPGWFTFAEANGGEPQISEQWGLGHSIFECLPAVLRSYYEEHLDQCLNAEKVWEHEYECSSDTTYRKFHQTIYPLGKTEGLLVVNSLVTERPHHPLDRLMMKPDDKLYADKQGVVSQCAYCRRVRNFAETGRWDWVPDWVESPPKAVSHTYCPTCFAFYFS